MDHIFKNKKSLFFRLIASLFHTNLGGELLTLTNLNVTSFPSPPSAPSQLLRSNERKYWAAGSVLHVCRTCHSSKMYPQLALHQPLQQTTFGQAGMMVSPHFAD